MTISGIATQGHKKQQFWVTTYKLYYSDDGETYKEYSNVVGENVRSFCCDAVSVTKYMEKRCLLVNSQI